MKTEAKANRRHFIPFPVEAWYSWGQEKLDVKLFFQASKAYSFPTTQQFYYATATP